MFSLTDKQKLQWVELGPLNSVCLFTDPQHSYYSQLECHTFTV